MAATGRSLAELLTAIPQREVGGRISSDRFDYQKNWTLCLLLDLHLAGKDYVVLCEYHEDVTVLDAPADPTSATFYQVKTDGSSRWTLARLTKKSKAPDGVEKPSILGKLCGKALLLTGGACHFRFTSNAKYTFKLKPEFESDPPRLLLGSMLDAADASKLGAALSDELGRDMSTFVQQALGFEVAMLPLESHNETAMGTLAAFIDRHAQGCNVSIAPLYRSLLDEIRRRTAAASVGTDLTAMCLAKGISRAQLHGMLNSAIRSTPADRTWTLVMQLLVTEGVPLERQRLLSGAFRD